MPQTYKVDKSYHNSRFDRWFKANVLNLPQIDSIPENMIDFNEVGKEFYTEFKKLKPNKQSVWTVSDALK